MGVDWCLATLLVEARGQKVPHISPHVGVNTMEKIRKWRCVAGQMLKLLPLVDRAVANEPCGVVTHWSWVRRKVAETFFC